MLAFDMKPFAAGRSSADLNDDLDIGVSLVKYNNLAVSCVLKLFACSC